MIDISFFKDLDIRNKKIIISAAILLLALFISYAFIYKASIEKVIYYAKKTEQEIERNNLRDQIKDTENKKEGYVQKLSRIADSEAFRNMLSKIAIDLGIRVLSSKGLETEDIGNYKRLSVMFLLGSEYHKSGDFIARIENTGPFVMVKELRISTSYEELETGEFRRGPLATAAPLTEGKAYISLIIDTYTE